MTRHYGLDISDLREFCIKHQFYTRGDCLAYSRLFEKATKYDGSVDALENIACDIQNHSTYESMINFCYSGVSTKAIICDLMTSIERHCIRVWYD